MKLLSFIVLIGLSSIALKLNAQEITIFPGFWELEYYQGDEKINKKQLVSLLEKDQESLKLWKKSNTFNSLAWASLAMETGFAIWTFDKIRNDENSLVPAMATLTSAAAFIVFYLSSSKYKKESILRYNKNLKSKTAFRIGPSNKGLGIVLRF